MTRRAGTRGWRAHIRGVCATWLKKWSEEDDPAATNSALQRLNLKAVRPQEVRPAKKNAALAHGSGSNCKQTLRMWSHSVNRIDQGQLATAINRTTINTGFISITQKVRLSMPAKKIRGVPSSYQAGEKAKPKSVILVDDDLLVRNALTRLLRSAGFMVHAFARPSEVLSSRLPEYVAGC
jgi:hypothetical protein